MWDYDFQGAAVHLQRLFPIMHGPVEKEEGARGRVSGSPFLTVAVTLDIANMGKWSEVGETVGQQSDEMGDTWAALAQGYAFQPSTFIKKVLYVNNRDACQSLIV